MPDAEELALAGCCLISFFSCFRRLFDHICVRAIAIP